MVAADRPSCRDVEHPPGAHRCGGCGLLVFTCPACAKLSHNSRDAERGYCGACHQFTGEGAR
jgi:hypothetical protein